jgi:hypothetical protein
MLVHSHNFGVETRDLFFSVELFDVLIQNTILKVSMQNLIKVETKNNVKPDFEKMKLDWIFVGFLCS